MRLLFFISRSSESSFFLWSPCLFGGGGLLFWAVFFLLGGLNSNKNYYRVKWLFQRQVYLLTQTFIHEGKNLWNRLRGPGANISPGPMIHAFVSLYSQCGASVISRADQSRSYCGQQINGIKRTGSRLVKRTAWAPSASFKSIVSSLGPRRSCFLICITSCASSALGHRYAAPSANTGPT